jgi:hypothetical protein
MTNFVEKFVYTIPDACQASLTNVPAIDEPSPLASVSASMIAAMSVHRTSTAASTVQHNSIQTDDQHREASPGSTRAEDNSTVCINSCKCYFELFVLRCILPFLTAAMSTVAAGVTARACAGLAYTAVAPTADTIAARPSVEKRLAAVA